MSVRRAVTMRGATGDPGGALAPGGARRGPTSTPSTAAGPDPAARTESRASKDPENRDPETSEPEGTEPENEGARKRTTERTGAVAAAGTARGIGAPGPSAGETPEPGASTADSTATSASPASSGRTTSWAGTAASGASAASTAATPSAAPSAPAAGSATVSTAGASPDAAMAAAAAGSGGTGASGHAGDEPPGSRPKKPMLAAAAIVGALLIAVPFLVAGQDDRKPERTRTENAAGTVLDTERSAAPDTYTSKSPAPSVKPSKKEEKEKKQQPPPVPVVRKETPTPSPSASTTKPKPKTEKKAAVVELTPAEKLRRWANGRSGVQNTVLKNAATGQCVDIGGYGAGKINEPVNQFPCNNTAGDNQLWSLDIVSQNGGPQNAPLFLVRNSKDGLCLDLGDYGARAAGTKVSEFHCRPSGDNQLWWLDPRGDGTNWIRNAASNDLCMRPTGGGGAGNDARLEIADCGSGDHWIV
ncbi:RICIN domain-containing protein [Streptomyces sp. NPDC020403]|uniref:RICIN domain-containing protein n=1 Tax=unclassified Streptomyces TaxID=2593676 RepID=UPI0033ECC8D6